RDGRFVSCADKFRDRTLWHIFQRRGREVTRITDVKTGRRPWGIDDANARAKLALGQRFVRDIEAAAEVNRKLLERLPFVLQINTTEVAELARIIDDAERHIARLTAIG